MNSQVQVTEEGHARLVPDPVVARQRYHVSLMTLWRWTNDDSIGFPKPVVIRKRNYRDIDELDAWDRRMAGR